MEKVDELLAELEDILEQSRTVPFSSKVAVNRDEIYEIIDEIRRKLPEEIRQSRELIKDRNKILIDAQKEAGFKTIELWPGTPHFFLSYIEYSDCKHVRKLLDERDLTVKVITPENCTYQYQFAAQEKEQFEKSMAYFKKALDAGEELGVETMAINSGWGYWNEDREEAWKKSEAKRS